MLLAMSWQLAFCVNSAQALVISVCPQAVPVYLWYAGSTIDVKGATGKRGPPANVAFGGSLTSTKSRLQGSSLGSTQPASPVRARPRQVRLTCPCPACEDTCQSCDIACQLQLICKCNSAAMRLVWCPPHTECSLHSAVSHSRGRHKHTQLSLSGLHDGVAHVLRKDVLTDALGPVGRLLLSSSQ